jgi:hypothetical protein
MAESKIKSNFIELFKQLQALFAGVLPYSANKVEIFPFLASSIVAEMWVISLIFSVLASGIAYNIGRGSDSYLVSLSLVAFGFLTSIISAVIIILVGNSLLWDNQPRLQDGSLRLAIFSMFLGIGLVFGWLSSVLMPKRQSIQTASK